MAQNRENLYLRSETTAESLASNIVNDKMSSSEEQKSAYRQAIKDAFAIYWQNNAAKSGIKASDFNKSLNNISKLDTMVFSRIGALKKQCLFRQDSINAVRDTLNHPEWINYVFSSIVDTLSSTLHNDSIKIAILNSECYAIDSILNDRRNVLNDTLILFRSIIKQLDDLEKDLAGLKDNRSPNAILLSSMSLTENMLFDAEKELNKDFSQIDTKKLKDAIAAFDTNGDVIKTFDIEKYKTIKLQTDKIRPVIDAVTQIKSGIEQMSTKYDRTCNTKLQDSIKKEISKKGLDVKWKKIGNEVVSALANQESSFKNIKYLLQFIKDNNKDTIKVDFSISQTISDIVDFVNPGKNRYNLYYSNFNKILDEITNDFINNMETINKQGVPAYIDRKMAEL